MAEISHNLPDGTVLDTDEGPVTVGGERHSRYIRASWPDGCEGLFLPSEIKGIISTPPPTGAKYSDEFNEAVASLAMEWGREIVFVHKGKTRVVEPQDIFTSDKGNLLVAGDYEGEHRTFRFDKIENEVAIRPV